MRGPWEIVPGLFRQKRGLSGTKGFSIITDEQPQLVEFEITAALPTFWLKVKKKKILEDQNWYPTVRMDSEGSREYALNQYLNNFHISYL